MSETGGAEAVARALRSRNRTVSVAESLTCGGIAHRLGAAEGASTWFHGGVVAYASHVKFKVLGVDPGPVITERCARQMARGVRDLTGSDLGLAVTGVGGPDPVEDQPPGRVFLAVNGPAGEWSERCDFDGDCEEVVEATVRRALEVLARLADD